MQLKRGEAQREGVCVIGLDVDLMLSALAVMIV